MADTPDGSAPPATQGNSHLPSGSVPAGARQPGAMPAAESPTPTRIVDPEGGGDEDGGEDQGGVRHSHGGIEAANADLLKALAGGAGKRAREEEDQQREEGAAGGDDVYMGLFLKSGRLGIAVYEESEETLSVCEINDGSALGQDMEGLRTVLFQVRPTLVVTNAKPDKALEDALLNPGEGIEYNLSFAPSRNFQYDASKALLLQLDLAIFQSRDSDADKRRKISSEIDLEAKEGVSAAGGLLTHLQTSKIVDELSDSTVVAISRVKGLCLDRFLSIDPQTLSSLQIFHQDAHPSFSGCGSAKEGLSLFSLLDNTKSPLGRRLLRMWFVRPLLDESDINGRLKAVAFFSRESHRDLAGSLRNLLRGVKDVPRILLRIRKSTSSVSDWASLADSLEAMFQLREVCRQFTNDVSLDDEDDSVPSVFVQVRDDLNAKLHNLEVMLRSMIDFPESAQAKRLSIQPGICDELDERKRQYEGLGDFLHSIAEEESADLPPDANVELFVLFCPQLGYMVASPNDASRRFLETAPGFKLNFATNEWVYWKTPRMEELDETVGDIFAAICDREFQLANMIRTKMLEWHDKVLDACNLAAELDCVLSFAVAAVERGFCEPSLVKEAVLYIEGGRHPLCELCTQTFVPNGISLDSGSEGSAGLTIITGANFSGKSVCMKQAALIAFMAHIGSWVPAESCHVGLIDRIFSRVQSRESCATARSSFAIDLSQVALMLRNSTPRSLLLIDEFGKGTQPEDGISLLAASIRELLKRGKDCPRTIVVTHFRELFTLPGLLPPPEEAPISYGTMSVMRESEAAVPAARPEAEGGEAGSTGGGEDAGLVFLYKLEEGKCTDSHGHECAINAGVPPAIIERARAVAGKLSRREAIERMESKGEAAVKQRFQAAVSVLQRFDAERGDVRAFLRRLGNIAAPDAGAAES